MPQTPDRLDIRREMIAHRQALLAPARIAAATALADHLSHHPALEGTGYVAGYWAVRGEMSLHALLGGPRAGFVYCLPIVMPGSRLRFAPWRFGDPLVQNRFGIPEPDVAPSSTLAPEDLDAVLVPLVAFDRRGNRLGSGAGFYDRSFAFLRAAPRRPAKPLLIGVGYGFQEAPSLPAADWDVPLDLVATDHELIDCSAQASRLA